MKKLLLILLVLILCLPCESFSCVAEECQDIKIEHFFSHELIYSPTKAYSPSNSLRKCFDRDHLTTSEFKKILEELYNNNFCLINIEDGYEFVNGKWKQKSNLDFNGKKPIILSFDDMTYDTRNRGIVDKVVAKDGEFYDYCECEEVKYSQERDLIPILENFIKSHSDFSYNGARAILCVTGYNGAFGHRVFEGSYLPQRELEQAKKELSALVDLLKEKGYKLGCHSYNHCNCIYTNPNNFVCDLNKWENEIGEYIGKTNIYCYPGGIHKCRSQNNEFLKSKGFEIFLCTGKNLNVDEESDFGATYFYRHPLDGTTLRLCNEEYKNFFDTKKVYETARYLPFSYKQGY
ncbi:MAG: hypothetical protein ACI4L1_03400 [Christensenellales bacterium]